MRPITQKAREQIHAIATEMFKFCRMCDESELEIECHEGYPFDHDLEAIAWSILKWRDQVTVPEEEGKK
jgi:hypothetical protein